MTDARWTEVEDDIRSACRHFEMAVRLHEAGGFGDADDGDLHGNDLSAYRARMALQHAMLAGHTSLEAGLKRVLELLGEELPSGPQSHADLVRRVARPLNLPGLARPAILTPELERDVNETRRFRHRVMHDYDSFEPLRVGPSIEAARRLRRDLLPCIEAFRDMIDPPSAGPERKS